MYVITVPWTGVHPIGAKLKSYRKSVGYVRLNTTINLNAHGLDVSSGDHLRTSHLARIYRSPPASPASAGPSWIPTTKPQVLGGRIQFRGKCIYLN